MRRLEDRRHDLSCQAPVGLEHAMKVRIVEGGAAVVLDDLGSLS